ncbi:mucin-2-like [Myripristis murdjan]|uniref:mucin-2-like n=1 Tax=Myripristis murdjan TaxID=586833 RepID=UPI00117618C4|nr:mucin-2-like [Myripristis murdjan]
MLLSYLCLILSWNYILVEGFASNLFPQSCGNLDPTSGNGFNLHTAPGQTTPSPFTVSVSQTTYEPGQTITVTLEGTGQFIGFLLEAHEEGENVAVGRFILTSGDATLMTCNNKQDSAVRQSNNQGKTSVSVIWTASSAESPGNIVFKTTFMTRIDTYWIAVPSTVVRRTAATLTTTTPSPTTSAALTTTTPSPTTAAALTTTTASPTTASALTTTTPSPTTASALTTTAPSPTTASALTTTTASPIIASALTTTTASPIIASALTTTTPSPTTASALTTTTASPIIASALTTTTASPIIASALMTTTPSPTTTAALTTTTPSPTTSAALTTTTPSPTTAAALTTTTPSPTTAETLMTTTPSPTTTTALTTTTPSPTTAAALTTTTPSPTTADTLTTTTPSLTTSAVFNELIACIAIFASSSSPQSCGNLDPTSGPPNGSSFYAAPWQTTPSPFNISFSQTTYEPGQNITVTLEGTGQLIGFLLGAHEEGENVPEGRFVLTSGEAELLTCNNKQDSAVRQSNNQGKTSVSVIWTASSAESLGNIVFKATFMTRIDTYWIAVPSTVVRRTAAALTTTTPSPTTTSALMTTAPSPNTAATLTTTAPSHDHSTVSDHRFSSHDHSTVSEHRCSYQ